MHRELERLVARGVGGESRSVGGGVYPPVNVFNGPDEIVVECEVPGVKREALDLSITGETLVVKGTKSPPVDTDGENADITWQRRERGMGDFSRTVVLPEQVDAENVDAALRAGVLTIRLPKSEDAKPRQIKIQ
jgi:HSP20 family protein